jgi:hypothetical protein
MSEIDILKRENKRLRSAAKIDTIFIYFIGISCLVLIVIEMIK